MAMGPVFALFVGVVLFSDVVVCCLLATGPNLEMCCLTVCDEKRNVHPQTCLCLSLQVMLEGKNIEEGFGIAFRVLQVWKNLIYQALLLQK